MKIFLIWCKPPLSAISGTMPTPGLGLARERLNSGETVTIGGSGFGVMGIPVGIERGYITREEGAERALKIVNFLLTKADRVSWCMVSLA